MDIMTICKLNYFDTLLEITIFLLCSIVCNLRFESVFKLVQFYSFINLFKIIKWSTAISVQHYGSTLFALKYPAGAFEDSISAKSRGA